MAIIEVANVSKCFHLQPDRPRSFQELVVNALQRKPRQSSSQTFWALRNVSFAVDPGETLGIIGANGSGKSTCLKLLTRIVGPTSGTISVQGRVSALLELGVGFHPELSGRENIYLHGSVLGIPRREMAQRFEQVVSFAELERFIDIPVKFYSSGMYVRLAFAAAINVNADILLVDEVLAVGDQSFQDKCLEHIHALKASGVTIIFVSHSLDVVRNLCARAIWLDEGRLCEDGITETVVARYLEHVRQKEEAAATLARDAERAATAASPMPPVDTGRDCGSEGGAQAAGGIASPPATQLAAAPPMGEEAEPIARQRRRWGTREAEIIDVRFLDRDGREHLLLTTGQPMTVTLRYRAPQRIDRPVFGVAIHRNDGLHINGTNTYWAKFEIPFIEGEGEVRYTIDVLPLLEGTYYLSVALHDISEAHTYDYQNLAHGFKVHLGDVAERFGTVYIPCHWEHVPAGGSSEDQRP